MKNKNLYDILGLKPDATKEEIKISYRKLVRMYHPDVNKTAEAENYFKLLNNAVETLLDDAKRLQYDAMAGILRFQNDTVGKTQSAKEINPEKSHVENTKKQADNKDTKEFSGQETFKSTENSGFYQNKNPKNQANKESYENKTPENGPRSTKIDGKDIETIVKVSESEIKRGTVRKINVLHTDKCPKCLGRKYFNGMVCALCHGAGEKSEHKIMNVKIPAGIKHGTKMKIKGEGEYGKFGGKNGDLYLLIEIEKETKEKFEGKNIVVETSISPWQAALGGEIRVPLNNEYVKIKIPPLTKTMTRFKLRKEAPNGPISGLWAEYTIIVKIDISENLSKKELELYEKLRDLDKNKDF